MDDAQYQLHATGLLCSGKLSKLLDESSDPDFPDSAGYSAKYKFAGKGLAVRCDGLFFRMILDSSYNDAFHLHADGQCFLHYVCGNVEELRRQKGLAAGALVTVVLSRKPSYGKGEKHVVMHGRFDGIMINTSQNADGAECQREYSKIAILRVKTPDHPPAAPLAASDAPPPDADDPPRERDATGTDALAGDPFPDDCQHMVFDTESAPPDPSGRAITAHPMLQVGYVMTSHDFRETLEQWEAVLRYPGDVWTGNSTEDSVHKFRLKRMKLGQDAFGVVERMYAAIDRVTGCIVAHNADHDLRQLERSAESAGYTRVKRPVRVFDSMKCAGRIMSFMKGAPGGGGGARYPTLKLLAQEHGMASLGGAFHEALYDAATLAKIVRQWPLELISIFTYVVDV